MSWSAASVPWLAPLRRLDATITWLRAMRSESVPPISHDLRCGPRREDKAQVRLRAGQIQDSERECDRRHRVPEEGDGAPEKEQAELALGERAEACAVQAVSASRRLSQYRFIPA